MNLTVTTWRWLADIGFCVLVGRSDHHRRHHCRAAEESLHQNRVVVVVRRIRVSRFGEAHRSARLLARATARVIEGRGQLLRYGIEPARFDAAATEQTIG